MNYKYGFSKDPELVAEYLKGGTNLTNEEGIWMAWESDPELVKEALPPVLDYVDNVVSVYIMRIGDGTIGPAFMEAAIMLNASYEGKVGMYAPSFMMYGPGAEPATVMGREIFGINKKYADDIRLTKNGDQVNAHVIRGGRVIFDTTCKLGEYNDAEGGLAALGMPKKGDSGEGSAFFFTYDAHQIENSDTVFDAVHLNDTVSIATYTQDWIPGTIERVDMEESENDPWSSLEVVKFLGCGYSHQELHMIKQIQHRNVGDPAANMAKLITGKFDMSAFGKSTRVLNADFN